MLAIVLCGAVCRYLCCCCRLRRRCCCSVRDSHPEAIHESVSTAGAGRQVLWWLLKPFIQKSWRPDAARTSDELMAWRQVLRRLGLKLAVTSISSFVLKAVLELLDQLGVFAHGKNSTKFLLCRPFAPRVCPPCSPCFSSSSMPTIWPSPRTTTPGGL
jgi:hypothetical protein